MRVGLAVLVALLLPAVSWASPGSLDPGFGMGGVSRVELNGSSRASAAAVAPDGRVVVGGYAGVDRSPFGVAPERWTLVRLTASGRLDGSFGSQGVVDSGPGLVAGLVVQRDGAVLAVGEEPRDQSAYRSAAVVRRYRANGSLDPRFGSDGSVTLSGSGDDTSATAVLVQPDGRIVVAGADGAQSVIWRLTAQGATDSTFAQGGGCCTKGGCCPAGLRRFGHASELHCV